MRTVQTQVHKRVNAIAEQQARAKQASEQIRQQEAKVHAKRLKRARKRAERKMQLIAEVTQWAKAHDFFGMPVLNLGSIGFFETYYLQIRPTCGANFTRYDKSWDANTLFFWEQLQRLPRRRIVKAIAQISNEVGVPYV